MIKYLFLIFISFFLIIKNTYGFDYTINSNNLTLKGKVNDEYILDFIEILSNNEIERIIFDDVWFEQESDAIEFSDIIIDFDLDTHIINTCWDTCLYAFISGKKRTMEKGSNITFEMVSYQKDFLQDIIDNKDYEYFGGLAQYIIFIDNNTREKIINMLSLFIERKINPQFVIDLIRNANQKSWTPRRIVLENANVLN